MQESQPTANCQLMMVWDDDRMMQVIMFSCGVYCLLSTGLASARSLPCRVVVLQGCSYHFSLHQIGNLPNGMRSPQQPNLDRVSQAWQGKAVYSFVSRFISSSNPSTAQAGNARAFISSAATQLTADSFGLPLNEVLWR